MVNYASSGKKTATRAPGSFYFELRSFIRSVVNEINGAVTRLLDICEQKERDKASKLRLQTLETTADKPSQNEEIANRLLDKHGKLTALVYKMLYEKCQKTLKPWNMDKYIDVGVTEYRAQAANIYSKVKAMFNAKNLIFPSSTNIEIRGQKKNKESIKVLQNSIMTLNTKPLSKAR